MSRCCPAPDTVYDEDSLLKEIACSSGIDKLDPKIQKDISLLYEPIKLVLRGSHGALHTLLCIYEERKGSIQWKWIQIVFEDPLIHEMTTRRWNLCPDFESTKTWPYTFANQARVDLATTAITQCARRCVEFLVKCGAICASSYASDGESLFSIAMIHGKNDHTKNLLALSMKPHDLIQPVYAQPASENVQECYSILGMSTLDPQCFRTCWTRLRPLQEVSLSCLGPHGAKNICKFADPNLANDLLKRGVDLSMPDDRGQCQNWYPVMCQNSPESMLDWLLDRGCPLPYDALTYATTYDCVGAVHWILECLKKRKYLMIAH